MLFFASIVFYKYIYIMLRQARFLPAINRWADRYPGWAIVVVVGGGGDLGLWW